MPVEHCLHLRACPRCHGAMKADRDQYGPYRVCIACGYVFYPPGQSAMSQDEAMREQNKPKDKYWLPKGSRPKKEVV